MPSGEPKVPEQGFRRRVVGGFDENDVLAYVNALVNESQQQQMEYEEQIKQLQGQIDKMKKEQTNARACVEKLQDELLQQTQRAEKAENDHAESEKKLAESMEQYSVSESRATGYQGKYRQSQKTLLEWQNRCQQAEEELKQLRAEMAAQPEKPAPAADPAPAPVAPAPVPEPVQSVPEPQPEPQPISTPSIEARKILADARIYAENAERRMRREAEEQKHRMAENAKDLAAGVMVLRERLSRVDEKLSAAALDLENATAAIYAALDNTDADLESMGVKLNDFAQGTPESDPPPVPEEFAPPEQADPRPQPPVAPVASATAGVPAPGAAPAPRTAERLRPAATPTPASAARRVRPVPKAKPAPSPKRLRRSVHNSGSSRRAVAQSLLDAINRMSGDDK